MGAGGNHDTIGVDHEEYYKFGERPLLKEVADGERDVADSAHPVADQERPLPLSEYVKYYLDQGHYYYQEIVNCDQLTGEGYLVFVVHVSDDVVETVDVVSGVQAHCCEDNVEANYSEFEGF